MSFSILKHSRVLMVFRNETFCLKKYSWMISYGLVPKCSYVLILKKIVEAQLLIRFSK